MGSIKTVFAVALAASALWFIVGGFFAYGLISTQVASNGMSGIGAGRSPRLQARVSVWAALSRQRAATARSPNTWAPIDRVSAKVGTIWRWRSVRLEAHREPCTLQAGEVRRCPEVRPLGY